MLTVNLTQTELMQLERALREVPWLQALWEKLAAAAAKERARAAGTSASAVRMV